MLAMLARQRHELRQDPNLVPSPGALPRLNCSGVVFRCRIRSAPEASLGGEREADQHGDERQTPGCGGVAVSFRDAGFAGGRRVVTEWATRRRHDDATAAPRCPSRRALARLLTLARDKLTRTEATIAATVERQIPAIVAAREAIDAFYRLLRDRNAAGLGPWIEAALASPVASFAKGVIADQAAVTSAIELPWPNGQTEGNICKLKTRKRQFSWAVAPTSTCSGRGSRPWHNPLHQICVRPRIRRRLTCDLARRNRRAAWHRHNRPRKRSPAAEAAPHRF